MTTKKLITFFLASLCTVLFCSVLLGTPIYSSWGADDASSNDFTLTFDPSNILGDTTKLGNKDPATVTYSVVNYALLFLGLITVIMIIISGFMWIFAAGNEEKIKKAQDIMKGAILGLLVVMVSYGVAQYVFNKLVTITGGTLTP